MDRPGTIQREHWYVLAAAFLGWMFDGLEMGLFSVVARPALQDLLQATAADEAGVKRWISYVMASFLLGAAAGGILFGWLGDRIGRVRSMALSILAYSLFTGASYFVTTAPQLAVLRFLAALGMGGEWALGVALVVECWPERLRPMLSGVIGAAGNVGYLAIGLLVMSLEATRDNWRWTMLACASPALLAFAILAVVPESQRWKQAVRTAGARPLREIFTTRLIWPTLLATAFASVALIGTWGCVHAFLPSWADQLVGTVSPRTKGTVLVAVSIGAILGCFFAPIIGGKIGRRPAYFAMCLLSLASCQFLFRGLTQYDALFLAMALVVGCFTASFYGWLPLYLPELFPTRARTTGQGLSFNLGRVFATAGVLFAGNLEQLERLLGGVQRGTDSLLSSLLWTSAGTTYPKACATVALVYVVGMVLIWFAPETKGKPLPE